MPKKRKTTNRLFFSVSRKIHKSVRYDSDILLSSTKTLLSKLNAPSFFHRYLFMFSLPLSNTHRHTHTHDIPLFLYLYGFFLFVQLDDCMRSFSLQLIGAYQIPSVCFWQHSSRVDAIYLCNRDPFTCTHTHKSRKFFKLQFRKCFSRSQCNIGCELSWVVSFWFLNLLWWGSRTNWRI